jgi:hypothetical protein
MPLSQVGVQSLVQARRCTPAQHLDTHPPGDGGLVGLGGLAAETNQFVNK